MIADFCPKCNTTKPCQCPNKYEGDCDKSSHDDAIELLEELVANAVAYPSAIELNLYSGFDGEVWSKKVKKILNTKTNQTIK